MNAHCLKRIQALDQLGARLRDCPTPDDVGLNTKLSELQEIHEAAQALEERDDLVREKAKWSKASRKIYRNWDSLIELYKEFLVIAEIGEEHEESE